MTMESIRLSEHLLVEIFWQMGRARGHWMAPEGLHDLVSFIEGIFNERGPDEDGAVRIMMQDVTLDIYFDDRDLRPADRELNIEFLGAIMKSRQVKEEVKPPLPYSTVEVEAVDPVDANAVALAEWYATEAEDHWRTDDRIRGFFYDWAEKRVYVASMEMMRKVRTREIGVPDFAGKLIGMLVTSAMIIDGNIIAVEEPIDAESVRFDGQGFIDKELMDALTVRGIKRVFSGKRANRPESAEDRIQNADYFATRWTFSGAETPDVLRAVYRYCVLGETGDDIKRRLPPTIRG
ncbi:hypothetical protein [Hyphomicrobium sp.]|uniref:hypothetical protein n=1 Tax=Hyphomicrobium sp. TaxID=82 RepID=UPI002FE2B5EB